MNVAEIMTKDPFRVEPHEKLSHAVEVMLEKDVGWLPVCEGKRLVGVITDRDICRAAVTHSGPLTELVIAGTMATNVHGCAPDDDVRDLEALMRNYRVRRVPVVDDGKLVGVASVTDLALRGALDHGFAKPGLTAEEVVTVIAAIREPRTGAEKV